MRKLTTIDFIKNSNIAHNNYFDYGKSVYSTNDAYITITCPKHGDFKKRAASHMQGVGCKKCASDKMRISLEEFISRAVEKHKYKFDYSNVVMGNNKSEVKIICPKHGLFKQSIYEHLKGRDCQKCSNESRTYFTVDQRRLRRTIKARINTSLRRYKKSHKTMEYLGCSIYFYEGYLKSKFDPWMTWDNWGVFDPNKRTWHIDHIKPISSFDLSDPEQTKKAFHYSNTQPLSAIENLRKNKYI